jgi:hypothetical protein
VSRRGGTEWDLAVEALVTLAHFHQSLWKCDGFEALSVETHAVLSSLTADLANLLDALPRGQSEPEPKETEAAPLEQS